MNCKSCGTELPAGAMFCGECGATVAVPRLVEPQTRLRPGDTAIIRPLDPNVSVPEFLEPDFGAAARPATAPVRVPAPITTPARRTVAPIDEKMPTPPVPVTPAPSAHQLLESDHDDVEATRIVRNRPGDRFVLQFSTGENSTVFGTGLIGRNPVLQPGESVDQLVTIVDPGKSVSKTHLEFGQSAGVFWIIDRFSANGTVVRQPDARPQRVDPGKRQILARGTRVDIGEQFFVVS